MNITNMNGKNGVEIRCSFCNKTQDQVRKLIAGPGGVYICDECVDICADIIEEEFEEEQMQQQQQEYDEDDRQIQKQNQLAKGQLRQVTFQQPRGKLGSAGV